MSRKKECRPVESNPDPLKVKPAIVPLGHCRNAVRSPHLDLTYFRVERSGVKGKVMTYEINTYES